VTIGIPVYIMVTNIVTRSVPILQACQMKSVTEYLTFNLPERMAFRNITPQLEQIVEKSGVQEGLLLCNPRQR
jgi:hypothetical protein